MKLIQENKYFVVNIQLHDVKTTYLQAKYSNYLIYVVYNVQTNFYPKPIKWWYYISYFNPIGVQTVFILLVHSMFTNALPRN